jgi:DNA-binding NarL/FixJ family response regulator
MAEPEEELPGAPAAEQTSEADAPSADAAIAAEPEAKPEQAPLVVIDADATERARVEGFAEALGRPVRAFGPEALTPAEIDALGAAAAIAIAWDLGGRSGLDALDALVRRIAPPRPRLALAADGATRAMVAAGVRAGAAGFLARPWDADELATFVGDAP